MLKYETVTYNVADYSDVEKAIQEFYEVEDFSILADLEASNDTTVTYDLEKEPLDYYDLQQLTEFLETGKGDYLTHILLQNLVNEGVVPEGKLLIKISW